MRRACVIATVMPRSLNEPVGLCPSCFMSKRSTPAHSLTRCAGEERRVAFRMADDDVVGRRRQDELAISPDARRIRSAQIARRRSAKRAGRSVGVGRSA